MNPDVTLAQIRAAIDTGQYEDAADFFGYLDEWLCKGGFLPKEWSRKPPMIVIDSSTQLNPLREQLYHSQAHKLRVVIKGDCVKFKINEGVWSPPLGKIQEPY